MTSDFDSDGYDGEDDEDDHYKDNDDDDDDYDYQIGNSNAQCTGHATTVDEAPPERHTFKS